jgi:hypothetical protein
MSNIKIRDETVYENSKDQKKQKIEKEEYIFITYLNKKFEIKKQYIDEEKSYFSMSMEFLEKKDEEITLNFEKRDDISLYDFEQYLNFLQFLDFELTKGFLKMLDFDKGIKNEQYHPDEYYKLKLKEDYIRNNFYRLKLYENKYFNLIEVKNPNVNKKLLKIIFKLFYNERNKIIIAGGSLISELIKGSDIDIFLCCNEEDARKIITNLFEINSTDIKLSKIKISGIYSN